jgi:hypothetical protein
MYAPIYQATSYEPLRYAETRAEADYFSEEEARQVVEAAGCGSIVKFARYSNLPGCFPPIRHSSIWLKTYADGVWKDCNIHSA